jgi:pyruvate dehydrogenase E2 component (dihydrolipoamide acetyltransferase)
MDVEMKMPDLATTGGELRIMAWLVEVGAQVTRGAPLLEVETEKATMEVESIATGVLKRVLAEHGTSVAVGQVIALIATTATAAVGGSPVTEAAGPAAQPARPATAAAPDADAAVRSAAAAARGLFARNRSRSPAPAGGGTAVPMSPAQRTVARRMSESKRTAPHFYLQRAFDATRILARRAAPGGDALVWDAFFVVAAGRALQRYERMRCRMDGEHRCPSAADAVGVAVDLDGDLFVVPIARPAARPLPEVSADIRRAVERLRAGDPDLTRVQAADLTISNLGGAGVDAFIPIINPPEAAILGIGAITPQAVVVDGAVVARPRGMLTLAVDHRVANGKYAAAFLGEIVAQLEAGAESERA